LDSIKVEEKIALIKKMEQLSYDADKRIIHVPYVMYGDSKHYSKIANSKGLNKEDTQNFAYCYLGVLSEENGEKRMGMHFQITRDFAAFNVEELVNTAVGKSLSLLNSYPIESGSYPIVFDNDTTAALLGTFSAVFNAQNVLEGKSLLKDKINEVIASKLICLIDNGLHPDGFSTAAFDSEGYPSQETVLIEDGKLKTFLHNTHTAKMFNTKSTGNGSRSLKTSLRISPTNLYIKSGNMKREELLKMHPVIIEIVNVQGLHSGANFISGDFSLSAEGYLYKNGKRQYSLKPFTVSGNILSVLKNVEAIADDFQFNMSSIGAASVLIKELSVSG
jgi:PmbA protein